MSDEHHPVESVTVTAEVDGFFIDRAGNALLAGLASKAAARKATKAGRLRVNGERVPSQTRVWEGQVLSLAAHTSKGLTSLTVVDVLYEDSVMAVVFKPAGLPTVGWGRNTLVAALPGSLQPADAPDTLARPHPVHRLDARTRGLVVVAKTGRAAAEISRQLQDREVRKQYRAVVCGRLGGDGTVDLALDDRPAITRWASVSHSRALGIEWLTTVDLWPKTGRMHQLRRHLAHLGHPVVGDVRYAGDTKTPAGRGLLLQAVAIDLVHPISGEPLRVVAPEDPKFERHRERERWRWAKVFAPELLDPATGYFRGSKDTL